MSHHILIIELDRLCTVDQARALQNRVGGEFNADLFTLHSNPYHGNAHELASELSKLKYVGSVNLVFITEASSGVWRNGKKS